MVIGKVQWDRDSVFILIIFHPQEAFIHLLGEDMAELFTYIKLVQFSVLGLISCYCYSAMLTFCYEKRAFMFCYRAPSQFYNVLRSRVIRLMFTILINFKYRR